MLPRSKVAASRVAPAPIMAEDPSDKAVVVGAAAVGGIVGVYLFHELSTGVIFASVLAYAATTSSKFGNFAKSSGEAAAKVWNKSTELNEQYDVLPKAKSALDTVTTAADNLTSKLNEVKSSVTDKIDDKLKLSQATDKLT